MVSKKSIGKSFDISRWVVGIGFGLAALAGGITEVLIEWYQTRDLEIEAEAVLHRVERRIGDYDTVLLGVRSLFDTFGGVSSGKFNQYIDSLGLGARYPGILRMEYVERISAESGAGRGDAAPVYRPLGDPAFDAADSRFHLASTRLALSQGDPEEVAGFGRVGTVTGGEADSRAGLAYRLPIFAPGAPLGTAEERRAAYLGAVGAWIDIAKLFDEDVAPGARETLALRVSMPRPGIEGHLTQQLVVFESASAALAPLLRQRRIEFADHGFELDVLALRGDGWRAWGPAAGGAAVGAFLLALASWAATVLRARQERRLHEHERQVEGISHRLTMADLAASLAHELQQPLQGITSRVEALQIESMIGRLDSGAIDERLDDVMANVRRANGRLQQIREMCREERPAGRDEQVAADELLAEFKAFYTREARRFPYELVVAPPARGWRVQGERFALEAVLMNLARNGFQAMQSAGMARGAVRVSAVCQEGDDLLRILVADDGPGIPETRLDRLFDSFNSTKAEGMGIGLSFCRHVVKRYEGTIEARNRPEGGAEFSLVLRVCGAPPVPPTAASPITAAD